MAIINAIGFRLGAFHFENRDCERRNIALIFRDIQYSYSGHQFRDLDWLISSDMTAASDIPKRLLFSETIEMGHRITLYLRRLLPSPPNLRKSRYPHPSHAFSQLRRPKLKASLSSTKQAMSVRVQYSWPLPSSRLARIFLTSRPL